MSFDVSVIIPVYNAERFIEKAIKSALQQQEVAELIIVNDGSTDGSQDILEQLQKTDSRIKIFHHENRKNKGRSSTRNLAIEKAKSNYIAFLDADDYYLENRFKNDKLKFKQDKTLEGVYNAIGVCFYKETTVLEEAQLKLTTLTQKVKPELLFDALLTGRYGHFSIDGLTIKKQVLEKTGLFNTSLIVAEDTDLIWKMALKCHLEPGIIEKPLAMRGVHDNNVFNKDELYEYYNLKLYESILFWSCKNLIPIETVERFIERIWILKNRKNDSIFKNTKYWMYLTSKTSKFLFTHLTVKYFPLIRFRKKIFSFIYSKN